MSEIQKEAAVVAAAVAKILVHEPALTPTTATATATTTSAANVAPPAEKAVRAAAAAATAEVTWSKHTDPESGREYYVSSTGGTIICIYGQRERERDGWMERE